MGIKKELTLLLLIAFVQGALGSMCSNAIAPPSKPRGVNQIDRLSMTPLFELHITPLESKGSRPDQEAYMIDVSIEKGESFRFSQATLAANTNGSCGRGEFEFRSEDFVEIVQDYDEEEECPRLIKTIRRSSHTTKLPPLVWVPPSCGCITLRILIVVEEAGAIYYAENDDVTNGPLAKTVCFQQKPQTISREQRLAGLCHVLDKHSSSEILSRSQFQRHRQMEPEWMDHLGLEMALELRRNDAKICCNKIGKDAMMRCFDNARRQRIDGFCEDGIPDIPFKTFRRQHMMALEKSCCFILGEFRYKCFAKNSQLVAGRQDASLFDYSMDASDIANDLSDFGSREHLDEFLRPIEFGSREIEEDEDDVDTEKEVEDEYQDESEEDQNYGMMSRKDAKKLRVIQRSPQKFNKEVIRKDELIKSRSTTHKTKTAKPTTLSKKETKRQLRRKSKSRNSQESRLASSAERRRRQKVNKPRKLGRRGSAERRERTRKMPRIPGNGGYRGTSEEGHSYYFPRYDQIDHRGNEGPGVTKKTSHEVKGDISIGGRRPMRLDKDSMPGRYGFDDQQGYTRDRILKKLQKKMERVRLLNLCCEAGVNIGGHVYGGIGQVTDECRHSSDKFVREMELRGRTRKCAGQFMDCCLEEAKKGLTMTSQEFLDSNGYWMDNTGGYDPRLMGRVLSQRGQRPVYSAQRRDDLKKNRRDNSENRNIVSERKTVPQQEEEDSSASKLPQTNLETVEKYYTEETRKGLRTSSRQAETSEKSGSSVKTTQPKDVEDGRLDTRKSGHNYDPSQTEFSTTKEWIAPTAAIQEEIIYVDVDGPSGISNNTNDENKGQNDKTFKETKSESDPVENREATDSEKSDGSQENIMTENPVITKDDEFYDKTDIVSDKLLPTSHLKMPTHTTRTQSLAQSRRSGSRIGRQKQTGGQSQRKSRGRQNRGRKSNKYSNNRRKDKQLLRSKVAALDSREMADRNIKKYYKMEALDSNEMADQYIQNSKRTNRYRGNYRNYRYATTSLSKGRRRMRLG